LGLRSTTVATATIVDSRVTMVRARRTGRSRRHHAVVETATRMRRLDARTDRLASERAAAKMLRCVHAVLLAAEHDEPGVAEIAVQRDDLAGSRKIENGTYLLLRHDRRNVAQNQNLTFNLDRAHALTRSVHLEASRLAHHVQNDVAVVRHIAHFGETGDQINHHVPLRVHLTL